MAKEKKKLPLAAYIFIGLVLGILAGAALMKTPEIAVNSSLYLSYCSLS